MSKVMRGKNTFAYVPGARLITNEFGMAKWKPAKPMSYVLHFRNAAARLRAFANFIRAGNSPDSPAGKVENLILHAGPRDVVKVPLYRGLDARLANQLRAGIRRERSLRGELLLAAA